MKFSYLTEDEKLRFDQIRHKPEYEISQYALLSHRRELIEIIENIELRGQKARGER